MKVFVINKTIGYLAHILPFFHKSYVILSDNCNLNPYFKLTLNISILRKLCKDSLIVIIFWTLAFPIRCIALDTKKQPYVA